MNGYEGLEMRSPRYEMKVAQANIPGNKCVGIVVKGEIQRLPI